MLEKIKITEIINQSANKKKKVNGQLKRPFGGFMYNKDELFVVNYHSTPKKFMDNFESQVLFFKKHFNVINPFELEKFFFEKTKQTRCSLLFTFDDGLKNNLHAAKLLKKHGITAFYFLVPEFIETDKTKQKTYYTQHIRQYTNPYIDSESEDFDALSWDEINKLLSEGNRIGSHTYTHTLLAATSNNANSLVEIKNSKLYFENRTGSNINSFCSINNTLLSVGKLEKKMIAENYMFHFTTLPGYNGGNKNPLFIKRRNIECYWLAGAVYFALGKWDLFRWRGLIEKYEKLK